MEHDNPIADGRYIRLAITPSVGLLWIGSSMVSAFGCYLAGSYNVIRTTSRYLTDGQLEGGKGFAIGLPMLAASVLMGIGLIIAIAGLLWSLFADRRPILSRAYAIAAVILLIPGPVYILEGSAWGWW